MSFTISRSIRQVGLNTLVRSQRSTFFPLGASSLSKVYCEKIRCNTTKVKPSLEASNIETPKSDDLPIHPVNRWEGSWHWFIERGLSVSLVPMLGVSMIYGGHPANDFLLGFVVPIHTHIGLSALVTDYLPKRKMPTINRVVSAIQLILTGGTIYGCYIINTEDIGLTEFFKKAWKA